jgi:AcrR family transcriptional regulator
MNSPVSVTVETAERHSAVPIKNRRGLETRLRAIDVAKHLMSRHGYTEVTLDQVSAAASVSKSSLLWHFGSKEMLLAEAASSLFREIEADLQFGDLSHLSVEQRAAELFARIGSYLTANPETKGVVLTLLFSATTPDRVKEHIRASWDGHVRVLAETLSTLERPLPADMARMLVAIFQGCYCQWYANGCREPIDDHLRPGLELFVGWLRRPDARD